MDRADIVQYVDLPPPEAIYEILRGCLIELVKRGIVAEVVRLAHLCRTSRTNGNVLGRPESRPRPDIRTDDRFFQT